MFIFPKIKVSSDKMPNKISPCVFLQSVFSHPKPPMYRCSQQHTHQPCLCDSSESDLKIRISSYLLFPSLLSFFSSCVSVHLLIGVIKHQDKYCQQKYCFGVVPNLRYCIGTDQKMLK